MMRRFPLLFTLLALTSCGGVELRSDFAEDILVAPYAELALQIYGPFSIEINGGSDVSEIDQPALDRFRRLVEADLDARGKKVVDDPERAQSFLRADLLVSHSSETHWVIDMRHQPVRHIDDQRPVGEKTYHNPTGARSVSPYSMDTSRGGDNQVWYTYVLSWYLHGIDRPVWVGTVHARARYGGGDVHEGTRMLLGLLFDGEERLR